MAVRMGTNEVSRRGMTSTEMGHIARLVGRAVSGEDVSQDAFRLAKRFKRLRYTL
ncbi:hypothetical protein HRbin01_01532 [archaeon HR01]|nr:hypothetical protein HRbin01_01532 [archaeon HR01]